MKIRNVQLIPDLSYHIDCALENREIDAATSIILNLYGDTQKIDHIINGNGKDKDYSYENRISVARQLILYANTIFKKLPQERQGHIVHMDSNSLIYGLFNMCQFLSSCAIHDACEGGALKDFKPNKDSYCEPTKKISRRIHSPSFIRLYVKRAGKETEYERINVREHLKKRHLVPHKFIVDGEELIHEDFNTQRNTQRNLMLLRLGERDWVDTIPKGHIKKKRKAILKSMNLLSNSVGKDEVKKFISGKPIIIKGRIASFELTKSTTLYAEDHGALRVSLYDKEGHNLTDLCVFIKGTPLLDQVLALKLWVDSGNEQEIINRSNVFNIKECGIDHPLLIDKSKTRFDFERNTDAFDRMTKIMERRRIRDEAYWYKTKNIWLEAAGDYIIRPIIRELQTNGYRKISARFEKEGFATV